MAVEFTLTVYLVLYLTEQLGYAVVAAGAMLAMTGIAGAIGKVFIGLVSDRILRGRRKLIYISLAFLSIIVCIILALCSEQLGWLIYPLLIVSGVAIFGWGGIYIIMAAEIGGREYAGFSTGTCLAISIIGCIAGPPLFGWLVDITNSYTAAWLAMAACAAIAVLLIAFTPEKKAPN